MGGMSYICGQNYNVMITTSNISFNVSPSVYLGATRYAQKKGTDIETLLQTFLSSIAQHDAEDMKTDALPNKVTKLEDLDDWTRQFVGVIHLDTNDLNGRYAREEYLANF